MEKTLLGLKEKLSFAGSLFADSWHSENGLMASADFALADEWQWIRIDLMEGS
jgi:hypothetical protein